MQGTSTKARTQSTSAEAAPSGYDCPAITDLARRPLGWGRMASSASAEPRWLTTAQAGKLLGVGPSVVVKWIRVGRLKGRREQDRWRVDPASVEEEAQRVARAGWWRRVDMPLGRAEAIQQSATKRLLRAASSWRRAPGDPELTAALIAAIDERERLSMTAKRPTEEQ